MIKIFTIGSESKSAEKLGFPVFLSEMDRIDDHDKDIIIRWGFSYKLYDKNDQYKEFSKVINPGSKIELNCRKNEALKLLSQVVKTPHIFDKAVPAGKLAVVRPTSHTGGAGFNVMQGPIKLDEWQYSTEFIKTSTEFRVWFAGNKTLCARRVTKKQIPQYPCRSNWGYKFCKISDRLHRDTLLAKDKIGLELGAADVLYYRNNYYFLELNSAPTLDAKKLVTFYKTNVLKLVKEKFEYNHE